ncbi:ABC-2 transporter permease [Clostridioides difficile]
MKGLLLKDFFVIKSSTLILLIGFAVFGFGISFYAPPFVLTLIASIILGQFVTTTIYSDRKSGWLKTSVTFPISRQAHISSKYFMYTLLCIFGIIFGTGLGVIITFIRNEINTQLILLFMCMTVVMVFISGAILIPCYYFIKEELSGALGILAYGASGAFFFGIMKLIENHTLAIGISVAISICTFIISWYLLCKHLSNKDI